MCLMLKHMLHPFVCAEQGVARRNYGKQKVEACKRNLLLTRHWMSSELKVKRRISCLLRLNYMRLIEDIYQTLSLYINMPVCVRHGIQSEDENKYNTVKVRTCLQSDDMYSAYGGGIDEYELYPRFVLHLLAIHICPHFECIDAKFVFALIYLCTLFHTPFTLICPRFECQRTEWYVCKCILMLEHSHRKLC